MLASQFKILMQSGEEIPTSWIECDVCKNMFFVPTVPENEPRYCCYCGVKFAGFETAEGEKHTFQGQE